MSSPYLEYFGLQREPFTIAPDPSLLYPSNNHREAVAHLRYGLECEGGFMLLTGEVGTGKTTLTRMLLSTLSSEVGFAYLLHSQHAADDLLASLLQELNIALPAAGAVSFSKQCIDLLYRDLLVAHSDNKKTLVVIEEAQNLSAELLEMLRLLSNLETDRSKLLHILLVGQPELLDTLAQQQLRQLNQRVVSRYHLQPLGRADIAAYIQHRLRAVGGRQPLFSAAALRQLAVLSEGIPRRLNLIAQQALIAGYAENVPQIGAKLVRHAARQALGEPARRGQRGWAVATLLVLLIAAAAVAVTWRADWLPASHFSVSAEAPLAPPLPASYRQPLQPGDSNKALVAWLQQQLLQQRLIEPGLITGGRYSAELETAVRRWQRRQGLPESGLLDAETVRSLQRHSTDSGEQ